MARKVKQDTQKVTLLTDCMVVDHTGLEGFFQTIYSPDTSLQVWKHMVVEDTVSIKCQVVALLVGNS